MKLKPSFESMNALVKSKLGSELESMFQEVIDYRDKNLKDISFHSRELAIQKYFGSKIAKRFMDTVWKHTGLNVEAVFFKIAFETSFCTYMCYGKSEELTADGTFQIEGILNGQANALVGDWFANREFTVDELMAIAKSFDVEKGIIKPEFRQKMKKWIRCAIGFDISLGFLSKDYLPKNSGVEYLTARELTAIMLHEIGHNLTLVEHAADMYAHVSSFNALRDIFTQKADEKKAVELGKKVSAYAAKCGFVKDADKLMKATLQAEKDVIAAGKHIDKQGKQCFIFSLIGSAFVLLFDVINTTANILVADPTRAALRGDDQKKKLGDVIINDRQWTWQERKADEFAVQHGYGADQVTALEKITRFYSLLGRSEKDIAEIIKAETNCKNLSLFTKLKLSYMAHVLMSNPQFRLYPPGADRYREILNLSIKNLKEHGASAEYVAKYMKDIEEILKSIEKMSREDKYFDEAWKRYQMFLKFTSIRSFISWFTHGRVDTELVELLNDIQKLNNNLVTFFGFKLIEMAKKV